MKTKEILYCEYFTTHFKLMYNRIFKDEYKSFDCRYTRCLKDYINKIKYNRSKRHYENHDKCYILDEMVEEKKAEETLKHTTGVIILSFEEISLPLPDAIKHIVYRYYRNVSPFTRELQDWFGENYCTRQYDRYYAQCSKIFTLRNIEDYYPGVDVEKLVLTEYFRTLEILEIHEGHYTVETVDIKMLLKHLKNKVIPIHIDIDEEALTKIAPYFDCDLDD